MDRLMISAASEGGVCTATKSETVLGVIMTTMTSTTPRTQNTPLLLYMRYV
jgi:hypothetical protein